tara:strand:- start:150 stop:404 length:255 start_codon:yes stop_codon:yes gene_type:complete
MFNRKTQNVEKIRNLKQLISKKYKLPENTIISIAELSCHEPDCPPIETIITARNEDGSMKNWRVAKSIEEIEESDINNLTNHTH